jgi:ATP-binding cassette subfamily B protein
MLETGAMGNLSVWRALGGSVDVAWFGIRQAWRWTPGLLLRLMLTSLVVAVTPAAQVLVVASLVHAADLGRSSAVVPPLVMLVLLVGASQVAAELSLVTFQRLYLALSRRYLDELLQAVARLSPQQLARAEMSARIQGARTSVPDLASLVNAVMSSVGTVVTAATLCASVWTINPIAGVLVALALLPGLLVYARTARRQEEIFVPMGKWRRRASYQAEQLVNQRSATELATLGTGGQVATAADNSLAEADRLMDRILVVLGRGTAWGGPATAVLLAGALVGIVIGGGGGAGVAAGILGVIAGTTATRAAGFAYGELVGTVPKVKAYRTLLADIDQDTDPTGHQVTHTAERLSATEVTVTYPDQDRPALTGFNLNVEVGSMVALVGVNGAGKTTAINALLGILDLDHGRVEINAVDAATLSPGRRLGHFGLLTQEFGRYDLTIRDSVRLGTPEPVSDEQIWAALDAAHIGDLVHGLPDSLDTQLGPQFEGIGLSGGQWQRLALARIYLRNAGIWILDEPTSAIDAEAEQQIFAELQGDKASRITIVTSHRAWTLRDVDHIYVLDHGEIVEHGRYEDLIGNSV